MPMTSRGRIGAAGLLVALGLVLASAVSAQVKPERGGPSARPASPVGVPTQKRPDAPVRGGQICAVSYEDRNANGRRDGGEGPLAGQNFTIANAAGAQLAQGATGGDGRFCSPRTLLLGDYRVHQILGGGWTNTDPGAASLNAKSVSLRTEGAVTVLFGTCRGERCAGGVESPAGGGPATASSSGNRAQVFLGRKKIVVSMAPGGGHPTTGLPAGKFSIETVCILGGQVQNYYVNLAAGSSDGVHSIPIGAVCTTTETPPPGNIAFAACPSGSGYWEPPLVAGSPLTMVTGWNYVTVTNRFVCTPPPPPAKVCVTKYNDRNGDGVRQTSTEPGLTGWTFKVKDANGVTVTTLTSTSGYPACSPFILPPGNYTIAEVLPASGWANTDPGGAAIEPFTVAAGGTFNAVFGNVQLSKICVRKYHDVNGNGAWAAPEPFLTGVPFQVTDSNGQIIHSGLTAAMGLYCTPNTLMPGLYTITETVLDGWTNTQPGVPSASVTLSSPLGVTVWFGNHKIPSIGELCVEKYNDLNGDGDQDPGEGPLQGWTFTRSGGGMPSLSGSTNANGRWCPGTELPPGTYTVTETMKSGWTSKDPGGLTPFKPAVVLSNQTTIVKFGNQQDPLPGEICVRKYKDSNNNGAYDAGELPLSGWQFTVRNASNTIVGVGSTGGAGQWCTPTLIPPGTYTVTETPQGGWTNTDPGGSTPVKTVVVGSNAAPTVWFGNRQP
jgi:hypothetical protein